jgi:peptide/nickel transport system substrate-binding protein
MLALAMLLAVTPPARAQATDTLTVALIAHPPTLDPHMHLEQVGILVNINMFDSLLHRGARLAYEPSLATSWRALSDTVWEFKLRPGVKFHNGDILTAEDVKYSFDRVLEPGREKKKSPQFGNVRAIKDVRIIAADTIHIVTDKPYPFLLERLVFFPIVPKKHVEKVGDEAFGTTAPVGTGPWKFVQWYRDQHIRLEAFDHHWRGKPPFKFVVIRAIPEMATQVAELKSGGVDLIWTVPADRVPDLRSHPRTYVTASPILRVHYVALDMRAAPMTNKLVRQAANLAVDKQALIQKMLAGLGRQVATVVQPPAFGYDPEVKPYGYDPKQARELLAKAGFPDGVDITLHSAFIEFRPVFEAICRMLTEVGIRATPKMWDPGPAWSKVLQQEGKATHGYYGSWGNYSVFDADAVLYPLYHTEAAGWIGKHYTRIDGLDRLIGEARSTVDQPRRKRIYAQIQHTIKEQAPAIFLWTQVDTLGLSRAVEYAARGDRWLWLFDAKPRR